MVMNCLSLLPEIALATSDTVVTSSTTSTGPSVNDKVIFVKNEEWVRCGITA